MKEKLTPWMFLAPFLFFFVATMVLPILITIGYSFQRVQRGGLLGETGSRAVFSGLDNYIETFRDGNFIASVERMLVFGVVQVTVMIVAALLLALLLESASARAPWLFRASYFLPYGVPGVIATILWSFLYVPGLSPLIDVAAWAGIDIDPLAPGVVLWSIANIVTWTYTGYNTLIIIAQLKSIPADVYEAARMDGAGPWRVMTQIQIPLVKPAILLTVVFSIIGTLQLFAEPLVLSRVSASIDPQYTPNMSAYTYAFVYNDLGMASAQAVIIALTAFVLSVIALVVTAKGGGR